MKHNLCLSCFVLLFSFSGLASAVAQQTLRVCTYNDPPLTSVDQSGHFQGIYIDVLNAIAHREHWKLVYLSRNWDTCLHLLSDHSVDLLTGIAYTNARAKKYLFNKKNILVDWGQIYLPKHSSIHSLMDLNGKRIATVQQGVLFGAFRDLLTRFGLKCTFVFEASPQMVFEALDKHEVDAGTVLRLDGLRLQDKYNVKSSSIVFAPLQLRFAAPLGSNQSILDTIDTNLTAMKANQGSVYNESMDRWLQSPGGFWKPPTWLWWTILGTGGLALLFIGIAVLSRWQVRRKTIDLNARNQQLNREITERNLVEEKLLRLNRSYTLLSSVNQAIVHSRSQQQLFESICRIIIEDGKFMMAWIGLLEGDAQTIRVVESNGYSDNYLSSLNITLGDSASGRGPTATAITENKYVICNDIEHDEIMKPWRERALQNGYRSSAAFPLHVFNSVAGVLNIYSSDVSFFNEQQILLLNELAMDISFALEFLDQEAQRNQAEEALRESEERFRSMFDNSMNGIVLLDASNQRIITANRTMCTMLGYREDELSTMSAYDLHPAEALPRIKRDLEEIGQGKLSTIHEVPMKKSDGRVFYAEVGASQVILDGKMHFLGVFRDISERKQAGEEQQKLLSIIESSSDLIGVADLEGRLLYMNSAGLQLVGLDSLAEAENKPIRDFRTGQDLANYEAEILPSIMEKGSWTGETVFRHFKTGEPIPIDMNGFLIRDPTTGRPLALGNISRSIADRKRAENEKQELQTQLLQAQKMESVGHLAGGVAHDFSNMLGVILGYTELALGKISPEEPLRVSLEEIRNATKRSAMLTQQLLAFARQQTIAPRVLNLNETIEGMLKMLKRLIGEDIDLAWQPERELWPVKMDPAQIDQIFANLCVNARDAIEGVGKVTIETENAVFDEDYRRTHAGFVSGEFVMLAVSDNGQGMDRETVGKIFDPFFTTKELGKGTGLGLATVYGIVKQNDGFINVYSEVGIGTTFKIYLPRHTDAVRQVRSEEPRAPVTRGQETILLVEDEPALLKLSKTALEMQGYRVLSAATPTRAIHLAEEHDGKIDLLMTDVIMPEMNGRELAGKLLSLYPGLKRLFTSGYTSSVIARHGVLEEGMHFIPKPFSPYDLATKVREVLDLGKGER